LPLVPTFSTSFYGAEIVDVENNAGYKLLRASVNLAYMRALQLPFESVSQYLIADGILNAESMITYRTLCHWRKHLLNRDSYPFRALAAANEAKVSKL
jgi:hypothetical protein